MNMNFTKLLGAIFFLSALTLKAQEISDHLYVPVQFNRDSLNGFDENAAIQQAQMNSTDHNVQIRIVDVLKRNYINFHYGLILPAPQPQVQAPCSNVDFEIGSITGWTASEGTNASASLTMSGCCPLVTSLAVVVGPGTDPNVPALQTVPAGSGNYTCRIGDMTTGTKFTRITQSFNVTAANSVFIYKYAVVLNPGGGHDCTQQPFFNIAFKDCSNNNIPCGQYQVSAPSTSCAGGTSFSTVPSSGYLYKDWTTAAFDLTSYIGSCVNIEFTVGGCGASGGTHFGYAYIDASCAPMTLNLNGTDIPVGQTNSSSCGAVSNNTLCAPPGFSYTWSGPGVTGQTGQCINAAIAGSYSVSLGIAGSSCAFNPILYSNFTYSPNPIVTSSVTQPVCATPAGSATLTATSGSGPYTYSWTPAAPSTSVNVNLPTNTQYTVSVRDANGCSGSTTFSIDPYPPAPAYILTTVPGLILSCTTPSTTMTFAASNSSTTAQWSGPSGPITGTTSIITTPGVYTYTAINTVSTCSLSGTVNITSTIVLPVLTSTLTQPNCTVPVGSATVNATSGTGPYTYSWTPAAALPYNTENTNLPPGTTYTVSAMDAAGCKGSTTFSVNNFSGAASYTLNNNPGLVLTCLSPSTTITFAPTNTNTTTDWTGPFGPITGTTTVGTLTGAYNYTATNTLSGCVITGSIGVTSIIAAPLATLAIACNTTMIHLEGTTTSPEFTTTWTTPTGSVIPNPSNSAAVGIFTLTVTDPSNGCVSTYTASAIHPTVSIVSAPNSGSLTCLVQAIQATAAPSPTNATVSWSNGTATTTINPYSITAPGTYTTYVQVLNGCSTQSVITIGTNTAADVSITLPFTVIPCSTGSLALTAVSSTGDPYTYVWTPATPSFTGNPYPAVNPGTYTVVALNTANGCMATATQAVTQETISASFVASTHNGLMPLTVTFTNTSSPNATTFNWDLGTGPAYTTTNAATVYNAQGSYTVILTARNGVCVATATDVILVDLVSSFNVPNVFTPNGDGRNDVFTFDAKNMGEITLTVFDRWGLKMFESTDSGNIIWDGKNKGGTTVTDGTYFYVIKATGLDNTPYDLKGTINVFQ